MTWSLCMIVKDEEENLSKCLNSVSGLFDEIIIVDTGSIDNTKNIAKNILIRYTILNGLMILVLLVILLF